MTEDQVRRVRASFSAVMPRMDAFATRFYDRMFAADPGLRALFPTDMTDQRGKLMLTLSTVIHELTNLDAIMPSVEDLARRHVGYGAKEEHYPLVGAALIAALREELPAFSREDDAAWSVVYGMLSNAMVQAAYRGG